MKKWHLLIILVVIVLVVFVWFLTQGRKGSPEILFEPSTSPTMTTDQQLLKSEESIITHENGLKTQDLVVGLGQEAKAGMLVGVHYSGWLENGTQFDSSLVRGEPFSFTIGAGEVIKGWDLGVAGMKVGGKRKLVIPADLGYGSRGAGGGLIPPNAILVFEVELLAVIK